MPRKPRINYTETDKALMWDRWKKRECILTCSSSEQQARTRLHKA